MVLIDGIKYSCQTCITGHRTTKCTHTDRPLVEIKKKGRPVSQCPDCREMRKTKSIHGRCDCAARRNQVKAPARILQNGIVDLVKARSPSPELEQAGAPKGLRVSQLLNPCNCLNGGRCRCSSSTSSASPSPSPSSSAEIPSPAKSCCSNKKKSTAIPTAEPSGHLPLNFASAPIVSFAEQPIKKSCCASKPTCTPTVAPPAITISPPASSGCCSSKLATKAVASPSTASHSIPTNTSTLFLPQTHGTASCFCGDTCACVGCPTHDAQGLKVASLSTASAAVSCGCGSGDETMDGEGGGKPCCGGAIGQLGLAQAAGWSELERIREQTAGIKLPPLLWGLGGQDGEEGRGRLPKLSWPLSGGGWGEKEKGKGDDAGGGSIKGGGNGGVHAERSSSVEQSDEEESKEQEHGLEHLLTTANPIRRVNQTPHLSTPSSTLTKSSNKRRAPPSPPPPLSRNTRSRTTSPRDSSNTISTPSSANLATEAAAEAHPIPAPTSSSPTDAAVADSRASQKQGDPVLIRLSSLEEELTSGDMDVEIAAGGGEGAGGCGTACRCAKESGGAVEQEENVEGEGEEDGGKGEFAGEVGVGGNGREEGEGAGVAAFVPFPTDTSRLLLQNQLQQQLHSSANYSDASLLAQLDPLAGLPPLPLLPGFDFLQPNIPAQPSVHPHQTSAFTATVTARPPPPTVQTSTSSTSSGCCNSRSTRPNPLAEDDPLELELLRAEDIESYDFGASYHGFGGGGREGFWPPALNATAYRAEQQQGEQGEVIDEWEEDARVRAELMAAGFC